MVDTIALS